MTSKKLKTIKSLTMLSTVFLSGCFGSVETVRCVYTSKTDYFRCHKYEASERGVGRTSDSWNVSRKNMGVAVCVPGREWADNVWPKIKEAWRFCDNRNCW